MLLPRRDHEPEDLTTVPMTRDEAEQATAAIRHHLNETRGLLLEVNERRGYKALGYATFAQYVEAELHVSRSRAYQLLDHERVVLAVTEAAGLSTAVDISSRASRDVKANLSELLPLVREATGDVGDENERSGIATNFVNAFRSPPALPRPPPPPPRRPVQFETGAGAFNLLISGASKAEQGALALNPDDLPRLTVDAARAHADRLRGQVRAIADAANRFDQWAARTERDHTTPRHGSRRP